MIQPYDCVVVANGCFPSAALPLRLLRQASVVIACDGAVAALHQQGFIPTAIVGDFDSIPDLFRTLYADRMHIIEDQETNDLTKAVQFAHRSRHKEVLILGATGKREDHSLGNISLLIDYMPLFDRVEMLTDYGWFTPIQGTTTLFSRPSEPISLFSFSPEHQIRTEGLRYPITHRSLTRWWQGTLNEAIAQQFTIHQPPDARLLIYRTIR